VPETNLPPDVERFLARCIDSVEQLETLLLLRRSGGEWTAESVARELRIDAHSAARRLAELAASRLLSESGRAYTYATGGYDVEVDAVARAYSERRVSVITFIFSRPTDRLKSFSDAFRIKGS
jgi:hypothetical protein